MVPAPNPIQGLLRADSLIGLACHEALPHGLVAFSDSNRYMTYEAMQYQYSSHINSNCQLALN